MRELDVLACPLAGRTLVEASAGTGKTWSICALALRFVLEEKLEIGRLLVLTFTRAASAELKTRIRARLMEALAFLEGAEGDGFLAALVARNEAGGQGREAMRALLHRALAAFDEATIFTLHGFCQRVLADAPLATRQPFDLEFSAEGAEEDALLRAVVADYWRRKIVRGDLPPAFLAFLAQKNTRPQTFVALARRHLQKPLARPLWPEKAGEEEAPGGPPATVDADLAAAFAAAQDCWQAERAVILRRLKERCLTDLKSCYNPHQLPAWAAEWDAWFAAGSPLLALAGPQVSFPRRALRANRKGKGRLPEHPFFDCAETLLRQHEARGIEAALPEKKKSAPEESGEEIRLARLYRDFLAWFPAAFAARKQHIRRFDFSDMLWNLHHALQGEAGRALARRLRHAYPAALIDEFQDTDPLQYGIFSTIYPPGEEEGEREENTEGNTALFFVGDPKQAIYSFRQADLPTYFAAARTVPEERVFGLNRNQRSSPAVLAGINALFSARENPFMRERLRFVRAVRGEKPLAEFIDHSEYEHGGPAEKERGAFHFWELPEKEPGQPLPTEEAERWAARVTAAEIARLLAAARRGEIRVGERPLQASGVVTLVRTHAEGRRVRRALAAFGVQAVELSPASVYEGERAREMQRLLAALLMPQDERRVKAALATVILGWNAGEILALDSDDSLLDRQIRIFSQARRHWQGKGILAALGELEREYGIHARLLELPDGEGERWLTDFLHLRERLHQSERESGSRKTPERLERDYAACLLDPWQDGEAAQLRLESDRNLVRIVTIHKAKGMEYDIVFCPFLWKTLSLPPEEAPGIVCHDEEERLVIDYRPQKSAREAARTRARKERAEELLRLYYVALTRPVHRCYLVYGFSQSPRGMKNNHGSLLNWLAAGGGSPDEWIAGKNLPSADALRLAWEEIIARAGRKMTSSAIGQGEKEGEREKTSPSFAAARFTRAEKLRPAWRMDSFSGLLRGAAWRGEEREHDALAGVAPAFDISVRDPSDDDSGDILRFPKGARAGDCIHAFFERLDFTDPATFAPAAAAALAAHPQEGEPALHQARLERMAADVLATPLGLEDDASFRLARLPSSRRFTELAFHLPVAHLEPERLAALMAAHGEPLPHLVAPELSGYLKGFIDLVFFHAGRYYLLDWKSNHLGWQARDYALPALARAMREHGYALQARLYQLALHRYLQTRLPGYTPERHLGGARYLFIRGVRPGWQIDDAPAG
ncbi:MAG: exodeoxyribonuclease V subunit beta, partial [Zoogloeaceae bacterium]|nr:exodeoxyribonuclease V subunit beta [Zoogloeaceae bacterium]